MSERTHIVIFGLGEACTARLPSLYLDEINPDQHVSIACIEEDELRPEHALAIEQADLLLFLRIDKATAAPLVFREVHASPTMARQPKPLDVESVLCVFRQIRDRPPPPAFEICLRKTCCDDLEPCACEAPEAVALAVDFLRSLLAQPEAAYWRNRLPNAEAGKTNRLR